MGSFGAGRYLVLLAGALIALFGGSGQAQAYCNGDYCDSYRAPRVYYSSYKYADRYSDRYSYSYSDCGSACYRDSWRDSWSWLFGTSCDRGPCYRYRPRYARYSGYGYGWGSGFYGYNDIYHPKELPPLRAGDNGMLPGVSPRQEWFNKHGTTGYAYYGYYGPLYGHGHYYRSHYGYPYRYRHHRAGGTCGRYGYWNGDYCADARWEKPRYHHARWFR
ncbi:MAG: hypothetical protein NW223_06000 [Hyphomicrobiaceae bacterium]|nr:hypothetical protein [Hyphomicrobiaceae bacterium]